MSQSRNLSGCQVFRSEDLPVDWVCQDLGERLELAYGRALPERDRTPGPVAVYGSNGRIGTHNVAVVTGPGLVVGRKGTVGAVHFSEGPFWPIDTAYYVVPLTWDNVRYLHHLLDFLPLRHLNAATGVPGLSRRDAYVIRGAFPTEREQAAIARILDAVDEPLRRAIEVTDRALELDHSLLHELLENGIGLKRNTGRHYPSHWRLQRVDEVAEVGSGVTLGADVSGARTIELPYLRVANVQDGHLELSTVKTIRVPIDDVDNYSLQQGDVLMTEGGDIDKLGRGAIWSGQIADCLHQNHIFRIRANRSILEPEFYALIVESDIAKRYFNRVAKRTTNLASTNKTQVRAFRVAVMTASKAKLSAVRARVNALQGLKKSLLHDLLTGRVRVPALPEATAP
jgi:type I restriction enzyme S subunit